MSATAATPAVSVIVPSSGRADLLLRKLEALATQTAPAALVEVVLLDNACPQGVGARAEARAWPFALRVLRSSTRLPAAEARARAGAAAAAPLLWWSDDDAIPDADALAAHLAAQHRRPGVTVGAVRFEAPGARARYRPGRVGPAQLTGVNTVLPRDAYLRCAADLPPLPAPYGGEDAAVGFALAAAGVRFAAAPDAWVTHVGALPARLGHDPVRGGHAGANAAALAARHPTAGWALGVHPALLAAKRALLAPWWRDPARAPRPLRFEVAYARAAWDARGDRPRRPREETA